MMTPSRFAAAMRVALLTILSLLAAAWVALAWPTPAHGQPAAPASAASAPERLVATPDTACGAPGTGRRSGSTALVTLTGDEAKGLQVGPDGSWRWCAPPALTPSTLCGAPGVGIGADGAVYSKTEPGWRVNVSGRWEQCDRPCSGDGSARTWSVSGNVCTSFLRYSSTGRDDRSRDWGIPHGEAGHWQQWTGPMRGHLIERCDDGRRTAIGATCAPATACDTRVEALRGAQTYVYDGRQAPAPLGARVLLRAADGSTWPATCVAGDWEVPAALPSTTGPTSRPPKAARCGYSVLTLVEDGKTYRVRYLGPAVMPGSVVPGLELGGERVAQLVCGDDGRLRQVPPEQPADPTARWRELLGGQR